jgi:hypothetical protein
MADHGVDKTIVNSKSLPYPAGSFLSTSTSFVQAVERTRDFLYVLYEDTLVCLPILLILHFDGENH